MAKKDDKKNDPQICVNKNATRNFHLSWQMGEEEQATAGVLPDMIRMSVGIESLEDILWDIDQALHAAARV